MLLFAGTFSSTCCLLRSAGLTTAILSNHDSRCFWYTILCCTDPDSRSVSVQAPQAHAPSSQPDRSADVPQHTPQCEATLRPMPFSAHVIHVNQPMCLQTATSSSVVSSPDDVKLYVCPAVPAQADSQSLAPSAAHQPPPAPQARPPQQQYHTPQPPQPTPAPTVSLTSQVRMLYVSLLWQHCLHIPSACIASCSVVLFVLIQFCFV